MKTNVLQWMKLTHSSSSSNMQMNTQYDITIAYYTQHISLSLSFDWIV